MSEDRHPGQANCARMAKHTRTNLVGSENEARRVLQIAGLAAGFDPERYEASKHQSTPYSRLGGGLAIAFTRGRAL